MTPEQIRQACLQQASADAAISDEVMTTEAVLARARAYTAFVEGGSPATEEEQANVQS